MSILAQADCNYQTGGTSRLINTLTSSSQQTRAYSTASRGSDDFIPHLSPGTRTDMHLCVRICMCDSQRTTGSTPSARRRWIEMLMESSEVKCLLFVRLVVPSRCLRATVLGAPAKAAPYITVGISQVVWLSVPGPAMLCCASLTGREADHFLSGSLWLGFD